MLVFVFSLVYEALYASKVFRKGGCLNICLGYIHCSFVVCDLLHLLHKHQYLHLPGIPSLNYETYLLGFHGHCLCISKHVF